MTRSTAAGARRAPARHLLAWLLLLAGLVGPPAAVAAQEASGGAGAAQPAATSDRPSLPTPVLPGVPAAWPPPPAVAAPVYLLVDVATGQVLAEQGADEPRPVASTIKILTALTVLDLMEPDADVHVGPEVLDVPGASGSLLPGDVRPVRELLAILMVRSGNDVAEALAVAAAGDRDRFLEAMDATARRLGLPPRAFVSPSGLDDDQRLTARELAVLAVAALRDPVLAPLLALPEVTDPRAGIQANRNELIGTYPGATGVKTGFTAAAGNSLVASARRADRELVAVVLGAGEDPERFEDAAALLDHGFDAFAPVTLTAGHDLAVAGGAVTFTAGPVLLVVPADAAAELWLPLPVRVPESDLVATILVDGAAVGQVEVARSDRLPDPARGDAAVGRALADGAYAALRAALEGARLTGGAVR